MPTPLNFQFNLDDGMSGPASRMERKLRLVEKSIDDSEKALRGLDKELYRPRKPPQWMQDIDRRARENVASLERVRAAQERVARDAAKFDKQMAGPPAWMREIMGARTPGLQRMRTGPSVILGRGLESSGSFSVSSTMGALGGIAAEVAPFAIAIGAVTAAAEQLASKFADVAVSTSKFAIEQASFKKGTLASLEVMSGSKEQANFLFKYMGKLADVTPMTDKEVIGNMKQLMVGGLQRNEAKTLMVALSDVESVGEKGAGAGMLTQINQALSRGKFEGSDLKILSAYGVNLGHIYDNAAKLTGKSASEIRKHALDARVGLAAIEATIQQDFDKGGMLGTLTQKMGDSRMETQLSTLESNVGRLFQDIDFSPVLGALANLNAILDQDSETGERARGIFTSLFNDSFQALFGQYSGPEGLKQLRGDFERLLNVAEKFAKVIEGAAEVTGFLFRSGRTAMLGADEKTTTGELLGGAAIQAAPVAMLSAIPGIGPALGAAATAGMRYLTSGGPEEVADKVGAVPHAAGGNVFGPTLALIGEEGPEAVVPLRPMNTGAFGGMLGGGNVQVNVTVHASGEGGQSTAEAVARELRQVLPSALEDAFSRLAQHAGAA